MKTIVATLSFLFAAQSFAFTIECIGENNLDATQYDFESLKIESNQKGNSITINGNIAQLGETLPVHMNPLAKVSMKSESFTVVQPLQFGSIKLSAGSYLSYLQNRMQIQKYRDTVVTIIDFGKRFRINLDCQYKE